MRVLSVYSPVLTVICVVLLVYFSRCNSVTPTQFLITQTYLLIFMCSRPREIILIHVICQSNLLCMEVLNVICTLLLN